MTRANNTRFANDLSLSKTRRIIAKIAISNPAIRLTHGL